MKWYGIWHDGTGYSLSLEDDLEEFASLEDAKDKLTDRYLHGGYERQEFRYVHTEQQRVYTPCVTEDCEIWLFATPYGDLSCPDKRVYLGPRGAARTETC